jgi:sulfide:quinone oxidoreductase
VLIPRTPFQCPAAPYEFAFLIDDKLTETGMRDAVQLDIYTPEAQPMPSTGPAVGAALVALLHERDIAFHPATTVQWIEPESRQLVLEGGERPSFDLLVAVPPCAPPSPVVDAGFGDAGWIPVDARSLAARLEGVWAVGDVALIRLANGFALPKAAVFALGQAPVVARGVARHLGCDTPDQQFSGEGYCWVELGGGRAAKGVGSFLESPGPVVELYGPSHEYHVEKEDEERDLIAQWTAKEPWEETAHVNG